MSRVATVVRSVVALYRERDIPFLAGSVAYSAFVSLIPLLLLLLIAASAFGNEALRGYVIDVTSRYLAPDTVAVIEQSITRGADRVGFSLLGFVALLWSVLKVFRTLDKAFSELYSARIDAGIVEQLRDGTIVLGAMTAAVLAMVAVGALIALGPGLLGIAAPDGAGWLGGVGSRLPLVRVASFPGLVVGLTVAFLPMYYVFPDVEVSLREALPGAVFAAVGWTLLQAAFQVYVSLSSASRMYGAIGGVILLLTWLYFGAVAVLLGGATNVVLAGRERALTGTAPEPPSTDV